ncbi:ABC transporter ATP-binding protein [Lysobacter sp. GX 14042]|uniref:iron ABC transporter ATP-binding protein n=1 Tax=Lysobacter sp. GX 14042 TaxID=2907155 RepID=UPI001F2F83F8|nr:ABC transporter ATP-binding protein [Lysobacter sp. GX 14042]MCE7032928.1 ABC transporter ATP-binding protein [Lysobacter sp. GX 14042]
MIVTRSLQKAYGDHLVVDGVSLTLPAGGVTSIIGPNGAGKSTLLSMVSRLLAMDSGSVEVDGLDVARTPSNLLARRLAILRQDNHLSVRLTVQDLVAFGRYPHNLGRPGPDDRVHVDRSLAWLGLDELRTRYLDELSGGQRQRAFVAMALCQDTDYLLLDEPLNNLDIRHSSQMMERLRRAADELGRTVVVVLHDINFASWYSDTIVAMKNGRVHSEGPPGEIITGERLSDLYDTPIQVIEAQGRRICLFYEAANHAAGG